MTCKTIYYIIGIQIEKGWCIMENITSIFREKKLKLTPQRLAVYKYLMSTNEHPSAEIIYKSLQPEYPTMSLATVYKACLLYTSRCV